MPSALPTDEIYRAAIETAGRLDTSAPLDQAGTVHAFLDALGRRDATVVTVSDPLCDGRSEWVSVDDVDGVIVAVDRDALPPDPGSLLRHHHWQRVHLLTFAQDALAIRTISA